jgi:septal ring factor EnvC (AmiA/AmiB activator)
MADEPYVHIKLTKLDLSAEQAREILADPKMVVATKKEIEDLIAERNALRARAEAAEAERDKDLAEMRRFQGMVIKLTHAKDEAETRLARCVRGVELAARRINHLEALNSGLMKRISGITLACQVPTLKGPDGREWTFHPPDDVVRKYWEHLSKSVLDALAAVDSAEVKS